jgi:hypothetical protein
MRKLLICILLATTSVLAHAQQQIIRHKSHLRVVDATTKEEIPSMAHREICLGETPAILVLSLGQNSLHHPLIVLPWPADKPNPCKGLASLK